MAFMNAYYMLLSSLNSKRAQRNYYWIDISYQSRSYSPHEGEDVMMNNFISMENKQNYFELIYQISFCVYFVFFF